MNLLEFAKKELDLIGMTSEADDGVDIAMREHLLRMIEEFSNEGHSGFSASYAIGCLTRLLDYKPLTALTGADDEWTDVTEYGDGTILYQNKRCSTVFKNKDGAYDIHGKVFWEWWKDEETGKAVKSHYTSVDSRVPVTFPYVVPNEPIYEYRKSDSEPQSPPQTEDGLM